METVGGWIELAFELANDAVLQQWGQDVINDAASHSEGLVRQELESNPELLP